MVGMQMERTISKKGQIVIPKDIRKFLGLTAGTEIIFEVKDGVVMIKARKTGKEFVDDFLNVPKIRGKSPSTKVLKKVLEEEYELH
jgi:AbrB family looped-hinge helix DNA binding protein